VRRSAILDHLADALGNPPKPFLATDAAFKRRYPTNGPLHRLSTSSWPGMTDESQRPLVSVFQAIVHGGATGGAAADGTARKDGYRIANREGFRPVSAVRIYRWNRGLCG